MQNTVTAVIMFSILLAGSLRGANGDLGRGTDPLTNGSQEHPWRIQDLADFQQFRGNSLYWSGFARLECDLDLSATVYDRAPIAPSSSNLGFSGTRFSGHFDGSHHTIRHLRIASAGSFIGLFGAFSQTAIVTDLHLANAQVNGLDYAGILCGWSEGQIVNCSAGGTLTAYNFMSGRFGGLCGANGPNGTIDRCRSDITISVSNNAGGLCGVNYGLIDSSFSTGIVTGAADSAGGLCGANIGTIQRCFSTADVIDVDFAGGGLCGENSGLITDCYAAGAVAGGTTIGGLCGWNSYSYGESGVINNCYSTATVSGSTQVGGFCGTNNSFAGGSSNFWDTEMSGTEAGIGSGISNTLLVLGKSTAQMKQQSTFADAGWDFSDANGAAWMMLREGEDYPRLAWQEVMAGDIAGLYGVSAADVACLSRYWQMACSVNDCGRADIDGSGTVDIEDLLAVADNWLRGF